MADLDDQIDMTDVFAGADPVEDTSVEGDYGDEVVPDAAPEPAAEQAVEEEAVEEAVVEAAVEPTEQEQALEDLVDSPVEEASEEPQETPVEFKVPKSRLDEEIAKRRAMQAELDALKAEKEAPDGSGIQLSESNAKGLVDAVLEGDADKFNELYAADRAQIAADVAAQLRKEMMETTQQVSARTQAEIDLNAKAAEISARYEVFNEDAEGYDATLTDELVDMRDFYIQRGLAPAVALQKATDTLVTREGLNAPVQENVTPIRDTSPNVKTKMQAAENQPARVGGESNRANAEPAIDITQMSDDDLDKLSEEQWAKLRGDYVA